MGDVLRNVDCGLSVVNRRRLLLGVLPAAAVLVAGCSRASADELGGQAPLALIYGGPQGCPDCAPAVAALLRAAPRPFRTRYVGPDSGVALTSAVLAQARLYVQPGGGADLEGAWRQLRGSAELVRGWVREGGSYLGLCFGAYLAGRNPGFDLLPGDTDGYTSSPGAAVTDDRDTVVDVDWRGQRRHMYFQDGPAFYLNEGAGATVLATYPNGTVAAAVAPYGKGRVGVSGPHPEADESWYTEKGLSNPDGVRLDLAYDLVDATVGRS
ncbi:BPL-N domain-containing protein [Pseudonocardia spinosispora]|uniref:BPL-N domain-containing protein n=1 Tax=Pseudonocardia spinosispora TaxID=103441 RepID=UPI0004173244|nr:BPL-N domain-containing protein [Pseudonocardia spinosispora]